MLQTKELIQRSKGFLLKLLSKEFLIFLSFFVLSGFFWLMFTLNQTTEKEVSVPIVITNMPKNVVITSTNTDTVRITVRDKGYLLGAYIFGNKIHPVAINFQTFAKGDGMGTVSTADLQRLIYQQLYNSSRIVSMKPDKLEFYFNYGANKRVPVRFQGKVTTGENYFLTNTRILPDSVTIYATNEQLDQIRYVYIEPLNLHDITDTVRTMVRIERQTGIKSVPSTVKVELYPDVLTEKTVEVPITSVNMPEGKLLRTFPSKAVVRFVVGASQYRSITADGFSVMIDYNEIMAHPSEKCKLHLQTTPNGVSKARLEFNQVDYLIEQQ